MSFEKHRKYNSFTLLIELQRKNQKRESIKGPNNLKFARIFNYLLTSLHFFTQYSIGKGVRIIFYLH